MEACSRLQAPSPLLFDVGGEISVFYTSLPIVFAVLLCSVSMMSMRIWRLLVEGRKVWSESVVCAWRLLPQLMFYQTMPMMCSQTHSTYIIPVDIYIFFKIVADFTVSQWMLIPKFIKVKALCCCLQCSSINIMYR